MKFKSIAFDELSPEIFGAAKLAYWRPALPKLLDSSYPIFIPQKLVTLFWGELIPFSFELDYNIFDS